MLRSKPHLNIFRAILLLALATGACDEFGWNPLAPGPDDPLAEIALPPPTEMRFEIPTLKDASMLTDQRYDEETGILTRQRDWKTAPPEPVEASIVVRRRLNGGTVAVPDRPVDAVRFWRPLELRRLRFYQTYESRNSVGPVQWQRFTMGPRICVMFVQGWGPDSDRPVRSIAGYYCAPPARDLSEGQAETVVRSVRIRDSG